MSDITERIKKLLQKAEDEGTPENEALALTAKAAELAMRENLDISLLKPQEFNREIPVFEDILVYNPFSVPKSNLIAGIGASFGAKAVIHKSSAHNRAENAAILRVFGFKSDLEQVKVIFASTVIQGTSGSERRRRAGNTSRGYHSSYWYGFARGVAEQLKITSDSVIREIEGTNPGTSLMLADRGRQVDNLIKDTYNKVTHTRRTVSNSSGYNHGISDGNRAVISGSRSVNGIKAIGS